MKLHFCPNAALLHVESGKRSLPGPIYMVENTVDATFPGLFGLRDMAGLRLITDHEHGLVRDKTGRPYRLYPQSALTKLRQSVDKWNRRHSRSVQSRVRDSLEVGPERKRNPEASSTDAHPANSGRTSGPSSKGVLLRASDSNATPLESKASHSTITAPRPGSTRQEASSPAEGKTSRGEKSFGAMGLGSNPGRTSLSRRSSRRRRGLARKLGRSQGKLPSHPNFTWSAKRFARAESTRDIPYFHFCLIEAMNPLQSYLMNHSEALGRRFPHFAAYLQERQDHDLYLRHRWNSLWDQRFRMRTKKGVKNMIFSEEGLPTGTHPSVAAQAEGRSLDHMQGGPKRSPSGVSPVSISSADVPREEVSSRGLVLEVRPSSLESSSARRPGPSPSLGLGRRDRTISGAGPTGKSRRSGGAPSGSDADVGKGDTGEPRPNWDPGGRRRDPTKLLPSPQVPKSWQWDPTPPHLTTPIPLGGDALPKGPICFHPDFFESLQRKAQRRWVRDFKSVVQGGAIKRLGRQGSAREDYRPSPVDGGVTARGSTTLFLPRPGQVMKMLKGVYAMREQDPKTAALFLLPVDYTQDEDVQLFLHACCQKGETYRYGTLFKRPGASDWLQLNQAVSEYWLDPLCKSLGDLSPDQQRKLDEFLEEFADCIGDTTTRERQQGIPYVRLPVREDYEPSSDPPFKKNPKVTQLTIDFVKSLEKRGLVSRCTDNEAVFVCNSLCIPKSGERYRFVCTFSGLNRNMLKDPYGMITTDAVMAALEGMKWFTTIDLVDGFFALPLYPADRGYTAFHTPIGLYKWNVLPQGTAASPAIFQRTMDRWFAAYLWKKVIVWIDDLLVFSKTFEEHLVALREVFLIFRKYGLVASRRKLKCCMRSVKYIGFIFGVNGIQSDPEKLSAVHDMPRPSTRKEVRQFLGFANFYRRFMPPNFASIVAPLSALTSEKREFEWTPECTQAFNRIKHLLTTTPVLSHPDFSLPFHVHTDGSGKGVGAVLSQFVDGAYRPIAFCSRKLLPHQRHWAPAQQEAYAIYVAVVEKWRYYLSLCRVYVHTDHRNLIWLLKHNHKGMIGRWYTQLNAFDLDVVYVSGKSQVVADPLSRLLPEDAAHSPADPLTRPPKPEASPRISARLLVLLAPKLSAGVVNAHMSKFYGPDPLAFVFPAATRAQRRDHIVDRVDAGDQMPSSVKVPVSHDLSDVPVIPLGGRIPLRVWVREQVKDEVLGPIISYLSRKASDSTKVTNQLRARAQSYRLVNGILHYRTIRDIGIFDINQGWVIAVPASLQDRVINLCHADGTLGHVGVRKTVLRLRQRFFFRGIRRKVTRLIRKCVKCLRSKSTIFTLGTPLSPMVSFSPFRAICVDLYAPGVVSPEGFRYVLTVVCMCTRWVAFYPLKTKYSSEVVSVLARSWFHVHGVPEIILSDRGKEFLRVVSAVCEVLQIHHIQTTPYHPQSNGLCEAQHKTLTRELRVRSTRAASVSWPDLLTEISFSMNTTPAAILDNLSPFNLVFGRKPRLSSKDICFPRKFIPATLSNIKGTHQKYVSRLASNLEGLRFRALDSAIESKEIQREAHDRNRGSHAAAIHLDKVKRGSIVSVHHPTGVLTKLRYQWSEPSYLIIQASTNTCTAINLVSKEGRAGGYPPTVVINRKMMVPFPTSPSFFIGAKVRRQFQQGIYVGTVTNVIDDEGECLWHVVYRDFDSEDLNFNELVDAAFYHPALDTTHDLVLPEVGSFVWYSEQQRPRLGQVTGLDPTLPKPVTVRVFEPKEGAGALANAVFRPKPPKDDDRDKVGCFQQLHLSQVRSSFPALTTSGRLPSKAKRHLQACLRQ